MSLEQQCHMANLHQQLMTCAGYIVSLTSTPSCSEKFKNHVFCSVAQIAAKKTVQPEDPSTLTAPAGVKKCAPLPRAAKSKMIKKDSGQNSTKQTNNAKKKNSATGVTTRQQSKRGKKKHVETIVGTITSSHQCKTCGKNFKEKFNLNKHSYLHKAKALLYLNCGYSTNSPYMLTFHKKKCIEGKKFPCITCDIQFDHHMQLYYHNNKFH